MTVFTNQRIEKDLKHIKFNNIFRAIKTLLHWVIPLTAGHYWVLKWTKRNVICDNHNPVTTYLHRYSSSGEAFKTILDGLQADNIVSVGWKDLVSLLHITTCSPLSSIIKQFKGIQGVLNTQWCVYIKCLFLKGKKSSLLLFFLCIQWQDIWEWFKALPREV